MDHSDLVAELERIEKLAPFERLKLAKEKRTLQLKLYEQRERDYLKQKPTSNLKNKPLKHSRNVRFIHNVVLLEAAARNDIDEVRRLLMKGVSPDSVNEDGLTALHQCCIDDSENMMKLLIEFGANVNAEDSERWTPLHAAATCGHLHLVKYLISKGANLLAVNADGNMPYDICEDEQTLDYIESEMANRGVTQELIDQTRASIEKQMLADLKRSAANGQSLEFRDAVGATPLHIAAANGYLSVVEFLLDQHVATDSKDNDGWQPIHAAACWGQVEILELLVQNGADLKAKTKNHETPFDICEDPELKARITALRNEQENRAKAEHLKSRGSKTSGTNTRTHSVRRNSTRDKSLTPKKHVKNEAIIGFQGESHLGETSDDKPSSSEMSAEGANSDELDSRNIYHNLKRDTLGQIQFDDNERSRLKSKDGTSRRSAPPPPSDKASENGNIPTKNGNHNRANTAPDTQQHYGNNFSKLPDDVTGALVAPPSPTSSVRIFRGGTSEPVGGAKPKKNSCCVLL